MNEDVHVVFNRIAKNTLMQSDVMKAGNPEIITLTDSHNIGPICGLNSSDDEILKRSERLLRLQQIFKSLPG